MTVSQRPSSGASRPFFDPECAGTAGPSSIKCNACAWGLECDRRDECAHHIPHEEFRAACRQGLPTIDEGRRGYSLFACTPGKFERFAPLPGVDLV